MSRVKRVLSRRNAVVRTNGVWIALVLFGATWRKARKPRHSARGPLKRVHDAKRGGGSEAALDVAPPDGSFLGEDEETDVKADFPRTKLCI